MSGETFYVNIGTISFGGTGAVVGGDESQLLVERLLDMYRNWAAAEGVGFEQMEQTPAYGAGIRCVKFSLTGADQASFAALHDGTHTLVRIPPDDPNQRRHMSAVGVRSGHDPALPIPADMDGWGPERRRYVCDPHQVINDTRFGQIEIDPAIVFAGDFSALIEAVV
jgi:PCRF domain